MLKNRQRKIFSRISRISFVLACGLALVVQSGPAYALSQEQGDLYRKGIYHFDIDTCDTVSPDTVPVAAPAGATPATKVYLLGDSISLGAKSQIESGFREKDVDATVNASVGRSIKRPGTTGGNTTSGLAALDVGSAKSAIEDSDTFIIALGTNGEGSAETFRSNLQELITKIGSVKSGLNLYVVNIFSPAVSNKEAYNTMLSSFAGTGGFTVIDVAAQNVGVGGDNIHPTPAGQKTFADTIVNTVVNSSGGETSESAPTVSGNCVCSAEGNTTSSNLPGADNEEKTWNYFIGKGLTPVLTAGILGNMSQESGFNPENSQNPLPDTKDPSVFGYEVGVGKAWGIIQWDAGGRAIRYAEQAKITGPIYELGTQLDLVWWHMNNVSPTGYRNMLAKYKTNDEKEAVRIFEKLMEGAGIPAFPNREAAASAALAKYGQSGSATTVTTAEAGGTTCATTEDGAAAGSQTVTSEGYALPVVKEGMNLPCGRTTCHHDGTPASDLGITPRWEGSPVYAITKGKISGLGYRAGFGGSAAPQECVALHLVGDDGWDYWYGHIRKPKVKNGDTVQAGQQIAEIGQSACADDTPPHLHIDRGSPKGNGGGRQCCRDPGFIPLLDKIYEDTP